MIKLSEKIIELRLATRKATMYESNDGNKKSTLDLKSKVIFLLRNKDLSPTELTSSLLMAKSNLTILTSSMIDEGLIKKTKKKTDGREIIYSITDKGKQYLEKRLDYIDGMFSKIIESDEAAVKYEAEISDIIDLISFL